MSRFHEWTNKESGIGNWIKSQGYQLDVRNTKGKSDKYHLVEIRKIINKYSKFEKLKGSYSERILLINFQKFVEWFKTQNWNCYK